MKILPFLDKVEKYRSATQATHDNRTLRKKNVNFAAG